MPRLIDANAVIREVMERKNENNGKTDCAFKEGYACGLDYALERLDAAPAIDPGEQIHWVPCAERLPDGPGPYLYTNARGVVGMGTPALIGGQARIGCVIAWAELPTPWKEDEP